MYISFYPTSFAVWLQWYNKYYPAPSLICSHLKVRGWRVSILYNVVFGQEVEQNSSPRLYVSTGGGLIQIVSSRYFKKKTRFHLVRICVGNQTSGVRGGFTLPFCPRSSFDEVCMKQWLIRKERRRLRGEDKPGWSKRRGVERGNGPYAGRFP